MNILYYILLRTNEWQCSSVHWNEVFSNLSKLGHNVECINRNNLTTEKKSIDVEKKPLKCGNTKNILLNRLFSTTLYKLFKGEIDLFLSFLCELRIFLLAFILLIKRREDFDIIYRRHSLFNSEYLLARLFRIPLVEEVNGLYAIEAKISGGKDNFSLWIIDGIERFGMPKAGKIIVVTARLKEVLHNDYKIPENKMVVIENGANTDLFKPVNTVNARRVLELNVDADYICYVGSLMEWQGVEYLIEIIPSVSESCENAHFLIVGDGPLFPELVERAEQLGVSDKVTFFGSVPYEKVPLYMNASDICVVPKKPLKTGYSPLKLCEYMACAKPVIATRISGFEILEDNMAGFLVNPESAQEFADAVIMLIHDANLREKMGENGRVYVVKNRSWETVARKVAEVCESAVIKHKNKRR